MSNEAKKSVPNLVTKSVTARNDYRAASVVPGDHSCSAAKAIAGKRYLFSEVPRLPLADCTMAPNCLRKFKKDADRRAGDRRQSDAVETSRPFAGSENRKRGRRTAAKP
jgi:hypothetical protein